MLELNFKRNGQNESNFVNFRLDVEQMNSVFLESWTILRKIYKWKLV